MIPAKSAAPAPVRFEKLRSVLRVVRRRWKLILILTLIGVPAAALTWFLTSEPKPEYLTAEVEKGDLVQTVEAVATVISEKDLELKFPVSGIVEDLLVTEGDAVEEGQELARLRPGSLLAAVTAARAALTTSYAELRLLQEGTRPEDIAIAEAELRNKEASLALARSKYDSAIASLEKAESKLEKLNREAETALRGEVSVATSTITKELSVAQTALGVVEDVFEDTALRNVITGNQSADYAALELQRRQIGPRLMEAVRDSRSLDDYHDAIAVLRSARNLSSDVTAFVQKAYEFVAGLPPLGIFDFTKREDLKSTLSVQRSNMQASLSALDSAYTDLQDTAANYDTQIATEESALTTATNTRDQALIDINTFETAVQVSQAQLDLKRAGSRKGDIDAAWGRVQRAQADLEKAQADEDDTILRSPIEGTITKVNLKKGEFTPGQFSETVAAITILGVSPYRLEIFSSEVDIPKVRLGDSAELDLDAYPKRTFYASVTEIDPAATTIDGVPKYRIKLDFTQSYDELLKIGMTGDLDIITDTKEDVLFIPARAVIKNEEGEEIVRVLLDDETVEDRPVTVGMETITDIEIVDGLKEGETVIVLQK